jgi:hypothetical protein
MRVWHFSPATNGFGDHPTVLLKVNFKSAVGTPQLGTWPGFRSCKLPLAVLTLPIELHPYISRQITVYRLQIYVATEF